MYSESRLVRCLTYTGHLPTIPELCDFSMYTPVKQTSTKTFPPKQQIRTQPRIAILCEVITAVADAEKEALQVSITTVSWLFGTRIALELRPSYSWPPTCKFHRTTTPRMESLLLTSQEVLQTCLSAGADQNNDGCIDLQEFHSMLAPILV